MNEKNCESRSPDGDGQRRAGALDDGPDEVATYPLAGGPAAPQGSTGVVTASQGDGRLHGRTSEEPAAGSEPADSHTTSAVALPGRAQASPELKKLIAKWRDEATEGYESAYWSPDEIATVRRCADELETVLASADAAVQEPSPWHPIETAPKDGTTVLVFRFTPPSWSVVGLAFWMTLGKGSGWMAYGIPQLRDEPNTLGLAHPTHWMPLPAAPLPATKEPT